MEDAYVHGFRPKVTNLESWDYATSHVLNIDCSSWYNIFLDI